MPNFTDVWASVSRAIEDLGRGPITRAMEEDVLQLAEVYARERAVAQILAREVESSPPQLRGQALRDAILRSETPPGPSGALSVTNLSFMGMPVIVTPNAPPGVTIVDHQVLITPADFAVLREALKESSVTAEVSPPAEADPAPSSPGENKRDPDSFRFSVLDLGS